MNLPRESLHAARDFLLYVVGENPARGGLVETPARIVRAWKEDWGRGYDEKPAEHLKTFEDGAENYDQMVLVSNIPVWSTCEHHLALFWGHAHIGYLPDKKIVGLSKFARLVDGFARRLQVQERLTTQVACAIQDVLKPKGVGVVLECRHSCMESRGARVRGTTTTTSSLLGAYRLPEVRAEFFQLIQNNRQAVV
jgi:GTP cyclohydrolase IA